MSRARLSSFEHRLSDLAIRFVSGVGFCLSAFLVCLLCLVARAAPVSTADVYIDLDDRYADLQIERTDEGELLVEIETDDGVRHLTPGQFIETIAREQDEMRAKGVLFAVFNITTWWGILWVSVGLLGQLLFTFRMVLQWLASERQHRSVVPVGFWWGSLIGGAMLLTYFIWRKDIVGILGQSTGAIIYARNLWLIYYGARSEPTLPVAR